MAWRQPSKNPLGSLGQGVTDAFKGVASIFMQAAQRQYQDGLNARNDAKALRDQIQAGLSSDVSTIDSETRQAAQDLLKKLDGVIGAAPQQARSLMNQVNDAEITLAKGVTTTTSGVQGGPGAGRVEPGTVTDTTTPQGLAAKLASGVAAGERQFKTVDQFRQSAQSTLLPVLLNGKLDPNAKKQMTAAFFAGAPEGSLTPEMEALYGAAAGFSDPNQLREAIANADNAQAVASLNTTNAEVAAATKAQTIARIGYETGTAAANESLAQTNAKTAAAKSPYDIAAAKLNVDQLKQDIYTQRLQTYDQHNLSVAQLGQIKQAVEQSGVQFKQQMSDSDAKAVQAAFESGFDGSLNDNQKQMLAAYIGSTTHQDVKFGDSNYASFMNGQAESNLKVYQAGVQSAVLDVTAKKAGISLQQQQLDMLKQQFDFNTYQYGRIKDVNTLKDATDAQTVLYNAMQGGNVGQIEQYLNYLNHPDAYPKEAELLQKYGITKDGLVTAYAYANQQLQTDRMTDAKKLELLDGQVGLLAQQSDAQKTTTLGNLAKMVTSQESLDNLVKGLKANGRWQDGEIAMFRSMASANLAAVHMDAASKEYTALTQNVPEDPQERALWRDRLQNAAERAGLNKNVAASVADGLVTSYQQGKDKLDSTLAENKARLALIGAQIADLDARSKTYGLQQTIDLMKANAQSLQDQSLNLSRLVTSIQKQQIGEGCITQEQVTAQQVAGGVAAQTFGVPHGDPSKPGCRVLASRMAEVTNQQAVISNLQGQLTDYAPGATPGDLGGQTPPATGTPAPSTGGTVPNSESGAATAAAPAASTPLTVRVGSNFAGKNVTLDARGVSALQAGFASGSSDTDAIAFLRQQYGYDAATAKAVLKAYKARQ